MNYQKSSRKMNYGSKINIFLQKIKKYKLEIIASLELSFFLVNLNKEVITSIVFSGKNFEGRSNLAQLFLSGSFLFCFLLLIFVCLLLSERFILILTNKKVDLNKIFTDHFVETVIIVPLIILLIYPLKYIVNFATFPYPIEYREAAIISPAIDFSKGINPYTIANYPDHIYIYGVLYPLMVTPFVNLFEHPILAARLINAVFLVLFLGMSVWIFRKRNASYISILIGIIILLNSFCYIWVINGARPDIIGLFFAMASYSVILKGNPGSLRVVICAALCITSFYFKQYLVISIIPIALYLLLFVSKKRGALFIVASLILGLSSFILFRSYFPLFFEYTTLHYFGVVSNSVQYMEMQTVNFLRYFWPLCVLFFFSLHRKISTQNSKPNRNLNLRFSEFNAPFIQGFTFDLIDFGILFSVFILTFSLGQHKGNVYTYYGELLLPLLLYSAIPDMDTLFTKRIHRLLFQVLLIVFCLFPMKSLYSFDFKTTSDKFQSLSLYADKCKNIYDLTPLAAMNKIDRKMSPLYNNGQIQYMKTIIPKENSLFGKISVIPEKMLLLRLDEWNTTIENKLVNKEFDCIFTDKEQKFENYKMILEIKNILGNSSIFLQVPIN